MKLLTFVKLSNVVVEKPVLKMLNVKNVVS